MTVKEKFETMEYGPAPESADKVHAWLDQHERKFGHFIGGEWVDGTGHFASNNPANGEKLADIAAGGAGTVDAAVAAARAAQPDWEALGGHGRAKYLYALARLTQKHSRFLSVLESLDNGKPIRESRDIDIPLVARHFYHHAGWAQMLGEEFPGHKAHGVAAQVIPWNFPLLMLAWKIAPALAAGNTVVLKPAEYTSLTALRFAEMCQEAGLPAGVVNIITGAGETGAALVGHDDVDKVAFTGSTGVGKAIRRQVAGSGKALTLELGGKSPFIVFDDADIDSAIEGLVDAIWFNQGQVCCAGSRLLVQEGIEERFVAKLKARMAKLRLGDPLDKCIDMGAVVDPVQLQTISGLVDNSRKEGATVWQAELKAPEGGCFYPPTLLMDAGPDNIGFREEIFGPVLAVSSFRTQSEGMKLANNTRYGLAASVWSENINRALEVAAGLKAGVIWVNGTNMFDAAAGFGGYRESGIGREGGAEGMRAYLKPDWPASESTGAKGVTAARIEDGVDRTPKHYIGGKQVRPDSGYSLEVLDTSGARAGLVAEGKPKDIRNAVEAATGALAGWANTAAHGRAQVLYFVGENLSARADELAGKLHGLTGVSAAAAEAEVAASVSRIFSAAAMADKHDGLVHTPPIRGLALSVNEPVGVTAIFCPENQPLLGMATLVSHAAAAGNTVVAMPGLTGSLLAGDLLQVLETSDVPGGVINLVSGKHAAMAQAVAGHYGVDALWHFGDVSLAADIESEATENMKRTWLAGGDLDLSHDGPVSSRYLMQRATEVKNIWVPWGDAMSGGKSY